MDRVLGLEIIEVVEQAAIAQFLLNPHRSKMVG